MCIQYHVYNRRLGSRSRALAFFDFDLYQGIVQRHTHAATLKAGNTLLELWIRQSMGVVFSL